MDQYDQYDIMYTLGVGYVIALMAISGLYMRSMYTQYRDAHDKWYGITD
jgi:hypothetical protein